MDRNDVVVLILEAQSQGAEMVRPGGEAGQE